MQWKYPNFVHIVVLFGNKKKVLDASCVLELFCLHLNLLSSQTKLTIMS